MSPSCMRKVLPPSGNELLSLGCKRGFFNLFRLEERGTAAAMPTRHRIRARQRLFESSLAENGKILFSLGVCRHSSQLAIESSSQQFCDELFGTTSVHLNGGKNGNLDH
jgi:hypothetical protein